MQIWCGKSQRRTPAGEGGTPVDAAKRFALMLNFLRHDKEWAEENETFVLQVSFAEHVEWISFAEALVAAQRLVASADKGDV